MLHDVTVANRLFVRPELNAFLHFQVLVERYFVVFSCNLLYQVLVCCVHGVLAHVVQVLLFYLLLVEQPLHSENDLSVLYLVSIVFLCDFLRCVANNIIRFCVLNIRAHDLYLEKALEHFPVKNEVSDRDVAHGALHLFPPVVGKEARLADDVLAGHQLKVLDDVAVALRALEKLLVVIHWEALVFQLLRLL